MNLFGRKRKGEQQPTFASQNTYAWQGSGWYPPITGGGYGYTSGGGGGHTPVYFNTGNYHIGGGPVPLTTGGYTSGTTMVYASQGNYYIVVPQGEAIPAPEPGAPPDIIGTLRGYRTWTVWSDGLHSTGITEHRWREGPLTATCAESWPTIDRCPHPVPETWCGCGFYAFNDDETMSTCFHDPLVCGVVETWGNIIIHEVGFRAQHAKIVAAHIRKPKGRLVEPVHSRTRQPATAPLVETGSTVDEEVFAFFGGFEQGREITPAEIMSHYPNVAWYTSRQAMMSDYPPTPL